MNQRNEQIEGLRACGVVLVVLFHFFVRYQQIYSLPASAFANHVVSYFGNAGVAIFTVISGYYFCRSAAASFLTRLKKKILRLWPAYAIAVVLIFLITTVCQLPGRTVGLRDLLLNLFMINGFVGTPYVDGAHWYITTLLACTVWFEAIASMKDKRKQQILVLLWEGMILGGYAMQQGDGIMHTAGTGVLILGGGIFAPQMFCGYFLHAVRKEKKVFSFPSAALASSLLVVWFLQGAAASLLVILAMIMVFSCIRKKCHLLAGRLLVLTGNASYSIYLLHQNIGYCIIYKISRVNGSIVAGALTSSAVMIAAGILYYRFVEKPLRILANRKQKT